MLLRFLVAGACLMTWLDVSAQSIDTSALRLRMGEAIRFTVHIRTDDQSGRRSSPDCIQAGLQFGDTMLDTGQFRIRTQPDGNDTRVTLASPTVLTEPIARVQIELTCGARFAREVTVLAEPPAAHPRQDSAPNPAARGKPIRTAKARPASIHLEPRSEQLSGLPSAINDPPATTTEPLGSRLTDQQLGAIAAALLARLQRDNPVTPGMTQLLPSTPTPHRLRPATPEHSDAVADPVRQALLEELDHLRKEQEQTAVAMNALLARVDHQDRTRWPQLGWLSSMALLGLGAAWLVPRTWSAIQQRLTRRKKCTRPQPTSDWVDELMRSPPGSATRSTTPSDLPATSPDTCNPAGTEPAMPPVAVMTHVAPVLEASTDQPRSAGWPDADFGRPALDPSPSRDLLDDVESMMALGYPGACAAMLEEALQSGPGKHPVLLLHLLDVYRALDQPSYHERVCAQIEALYNVRVPPMGDVSGDGTSLADMPALLDSITRLWSTPGCAGAIEHLLIHPSSVAALDVSAFRDLLLLHAIAREHGQDDQRESVDVAEIESA